MTEIFQMLAVAAVLIFAWAMLFVILYSLTAVAAQPAYLVIYGAQVLLPGFPEKWRFRLPPKGYKAYLCNSVATLVTISLVEVGYASITPMRVILDAFRNGVALEEIPRILLQSGAFHSAIAQPPKSASLHCIMGLMVLLVISRIWSKPDGKDMMETLIDSGTSFLDAFKKWLGK